MSSSVLYLPLIVAACTALYYMPGALGDSNFTIGKCFPDRNNCSQCYQTLVESLLSSSDNLYRLSRAFFPPRDNPPEFVSVKYYFGDINSDKMNSSLWFWSLHTSYFLHSPHTFQFLSLFFGKPHLYYTGDLKIRLDEECINVSDEMMEFLTQRLKLYAQKQSTTPQIDDTYNAKGANGKTWKERLNNDKRIAQIIVCSQVFTVLFAVIIIALVGALRVLPKFITKREKNKTSRDICCTDVSKDKYCRQLSSDDTMPLTFSAFVLSIISNLYVLALDSAAIRYRDEIHDNNEDLTDIYDSESRNSPYDILYNLPVVVLVFDIVITAVLICIAVGSLLFLWGISKKTSEEKKSEEKTSEEKKSEEKTSEEKKSEEKTSEEKKSKKKRSQCHAIGCYAFSLSTGIICTIAVILMHFPYIAIAFLNDVYHAGSIFVYYSIIGFALFVIVELVYKYIIIKAASKCNPNVKPHITKSLCCKYYGSLIGLLFGIILLFLGLIITVSCYFVLIPINKSISDAPNRLIGLYQSGVIVIAAIVVYKTFLRKGRKPIHKAIKASKKFGEKDDWTKLTEEEKQDRFYAKVLAMVNEYKVAESEEEGKQSQADEKETRTSREAIVADTDTQPSELNEENTDTPQPMATLLIDS